MKYYVNEEPSDRSIRTLEYDYDSDEKELAWLYATEKLLDDGCHDAQLNDVWSKIAEIHYRQKIGIPKG